jgi:hypothetical protein
MLWFYSQIRWPNPRLAVLTFYFFTTLSALSDPIPGSFM